MAITSVSYTSHIATVTIKTEKFPLDFTSDRFHIDVLKDVLKTYFNLDNKSTNKDPNSILRIGIKKVPKYEETLGIKLFDGYEYDDSIIAAYNNTSLEKLKENGIQFWASDENTLIIRLHDLMSNGVGFTACQITVDIPNPENKSEVETAHTGVVLYPKLIQGDIVLHDESTADDDPQLKNWERRPDYVWSDTDIYEDMMYVNTISGTTNNGLITDTGIINVPGPLDHEPVPLYSVKTSALIPTSYWCNDPYTTDFGINFDLDSLSSCIYNKVTNEKMQDLPYDIEGPDDYTFTDDSNIACKRWVITQYLSNTVPDEINLNQVYLAMPVSGNFFGQPDPPKDRTPPPALLFENGFAIGLEKVNNYIAYVEQNKNSEER